MQPKKVILESIEGVIQTLDLKSVDFVVEHPASEFLGDYSSNVAMVMGGNPRERALKIVEELKKEQGLREVVDLERIEVAGPGFINFWLRKDWLVGELRKIDSDYGRGDWGKGKKVLVEYSSPNIAKRFSVGHFRSTIIGQAVRNLYEFSGFETVGDNHLGDWGTQFGMMIAAVEEEEGLDIASMSVDEMEELYVSYNKKVREDEEFLEKAREAFVRLEKDEVKARSIWKVAVEKSMEEFERIYELLGVKIENAYGESAYEELMVEVIKEAREKKVAKESEGALIVEFDNLPPAMLLKSNGTTTYFTRDLATVKFRQQGVLKSDLYIYEVGAEQTLHFQQVFAAAELLGYGKKKSFVHVSHGLILGKDGKKMSTRKGTTVKIEEWLKEIIEKAASINQESAQVVGIGGVKYFDLKHDPKTSYRFDWEQALKLDGDSGPYLQYAVVRAKSVLKEGKVVDEILDKAVNEEELAVMRWICRFPEMVEQATVSFGPNLLCSYLFELAQRFNAFYNKHRILESEEKDFRLLLTYAVSEILERGLLLLGIEVPEKM